MNTTINQLIQASRNLRRDAERAQHHDTIDVLDSVDETLTALRGHAAKSERTLQTCADFIARLRSDLQAFISSQTTSAT